MEILICRLSLVGEGKHEIILHIEDETKDDVV